MNFNSRAIIRIILIVAIVGETLAFNWDLLCVDETRISCVFLVGILVGVTVLGISEVSSIRVRSQNRERQIKYLRESINQILEKKRVSPEIQGEELKVYMGALLENIKLTVLSFYVDLNTDKSIEMLRIIDEYQILLQMHFEPTLWDRLIKDLEGLKWLDLKNVK